MSYQTKAYTKGASYFSSTIDLVIDIYEDAAKAMEDALQAIRDNHIEARYMATEKARKYLIGLASALNKSDEETQALSQMLQNYYNVINDLITRTNVHNKEESCKAAIDSLRDMAQTWREVKVKAREDAMHMPAEAPFMNGNAYYSA